MKKTLLALLALLTLLPFSAWGERVADTSVVGLATLEGAPVCTGLFMGDDLLFAPPVLTQGETYQVTGHNGFTTTALAQDYTFGGYHVLAMETPLSNFAMMGMMTESTVTLIDGLNREGDCWGSWTPDLTWQNKAACLLTANRPVSLGTVAFTSTGEAMGLVVAQWGGGVNRYVLLPLSSAMEEVSQLADAVESVRWVEGIPYTFDGHRVLMDWSQCDLPELTSEEEMILYYAADLNPYYHAMTLDSSARSATLVCVPGMDYHVYLRIAKKGTPYLGLEGDGTAFRTPMGNFFNRYGFHDTSMELSVLPVENSDPYTVIPTFLTTFTEETLRNPEENLFLSVLSNYDAP